MISTDATDGTGPLMNGIAPTGVATGASLFSSAYITTGVNPGYDDALLTTQFIATRPNMRAINHSWGKPTVMPNDLMDGNSQLTLGIDWSASQHNVLHLVAGNQGAAADLPIAKDNYNGMTIGRSSKVGGVFRQVSTGNNYSKDAEGDRTSIDLIAPGDDVELTGLGDVHRITPGGTSYATPHVTGTVALLNEFATPRVNAMANNWNGLINSEPTAYRHEVMKAVLMNSADKLIDDGTVTVPGGLTIPPGGLLGMERTVVKQDGSSTWFDGDSWDDSVDSGFGGFFQLDEEMGAGHLNAKRALQQFATGEHEEFGVNGTRVPVIGWDYGTTTGDNDVNRYRFNQELEAGSFIAITLAWDRDVQFDIDGGTTGFFDAGDTFEEYVDPGFGFPADDVINDLELYFQPAFAGNVNQARAFSSGNGTMQHIFFQVETTDEFEFWVRQTDEDVSVNQDYAVAWWALGSGPLIAGDFDGDGDVDGADLAQWESDYGVNGTSDADGDGDSDGADFLAWQRNFGFGVLSASATVPEPTSLALILLGLPWLSRRKALT